MRILLLIVTLLFTTSCAPDTPDPGATERRDLLYDLAVAPETDLAGYDRNLFDDYDRPALLAEAETDDGCLLSRADNRCHLQARDVDIDHIVSLAEAWQSGLSTRPVDEIARFGDTPSNLWVMTSSLNRSKGDDDPAEWLPPYTPAECPYLERWVAVKVEWDLTIDEIELLALEASGCFTLTR